MNYTSSRLSIDSTRNSFHLPVITDTRRMKTIPCKINILRDNHVNSCNIRARGIQQARDNTGQNMNNNRVIIWDGWRGMAILLLLTGHFFDQKWIWEDRLGVDAFFVLSGMLMSEILFVKRMRLRDFYIRRFSRIIPAFFVFVLAAYAFAVVASFSFESQEIIASLGFFRTYYPLAPHIWASDVPIGHLWSLNVEEHAYVIMSLLTLLILRGHKAAYTLIFLGLASIGICFYYYTHEAIAPTEFRIRTESAISFVFLSAGYHLFKRQINIRVPGYFPVLALLGAFSCYLTVMPDWLTFSVAPLLLAFSLNHIREAGFVLRGILELKVLRLMGLWSFSIYLWQQPFYEYAWVIPGGNYVAVVLAISAGFLSFYFLENPLRIWINKRWTKKFQKDQQSLGYVRE